MDQPLFISGSTINETVAKAIEAIMTRGKEIESRNGTARFLNDLTLEIRDPRERHLSLTGRKSNIFQLMAETFWVMAGESNVVDFLQFYLPRATDYSDDGKTWHGAYGGRIYANNQLDDVLRTFVTDGKNTRRAIIMIADPTKDNLEAIEQLYGKGHKPMDLPCNREIHFYVTDNKLNCKVIQRSGDMIFGTGSINPFEFTFLQELIYQRLLRLEGFEDLELGVYRWHITNAHIYSGYYEQAHDVIKHNIGRKYERGTLPISMPLGEHHFQAYVNDLTRMIQFENIDELKMCLEHYPIGEYFEIVDLYYALIKAYTIAKKMKTLMPKHTLTLHVRELPTSLLIAIEWSAFKNFNLQQSAKHTKFTISENK